MNPLKLAKVWRRMNIWEVSACGIPMYPKAHKSFSLKGPNGPRHRPAPKGKSDELNTENKEMEETEKPEEEETEEEETEEEESVEAPKGESEDSESESKPKSETSEDDLNEKAVKDIRNLIVKGFREAMKEVSTERGLVQIKDLQEQMSDELKKKSIGELAVMSGLFQKPAVVGSTRGFE